MLTRASIELINYKVNLLPYRVDAALYFTAEFWTAITEAGGDCEDYGIEKYLRCVRSGFPVTSLRLATCWIKPGQLPDDYHAVTIIRFNGADLCMDNRYPYVMELDLLPYEFHKLQVAGSQKWEYEKQFAINHPEQCVL
jgi:predicted transglutaminase-like cysteine proteinase